MYISNRKEAKAEIDEALELLKSREQIIFKSDFDEALDFIKNEDFVFLILCEVSLDDPEGMELLEKLQKDNHLRSKKIPFVLLTNTCSSSIVHKAFVNCTQGIFQRREDKYEFSDQLRKIIAYWEEFVKIRPRSMV